MVFAESGFELLDDATDEEYERILDRSFLWKYWLKIPASIRKDKFFMKEFILWAMVEYKN
jgi:magnesium chelatase subunit I